MQPDAAEGPGRAQAADRQQRACPVTQQELLQDLQHLEKVVEAKLAEIREKIERLH
ncbi:DUF3461 family protein [Pseudomonas lalucatii]|nr:DUF3461 family protein [Pseudomonas lalucatii]